MEINAYGQLVGDVVAGWTPRPAPLAWRVAGRYCRLEPLAPGHAPALAQALSQRWGEQPPEALWTYLPYGPFRAEEEYHAWVENLVATADTAMQAICVAGRACGVAALLRADPGVGSVEVGHVMFAPALGRTRAASEAMYLMARQVFEVWGYRRYEWKCDSANAASRRAALRFGFRPEGVWRQARVVKGRNRDTAWFAMTDGDWRRLAPAWEGWLHPGNFTAEGQQRSSLAALTDAALTDAAD